MIVDAVYARPADRQAIERVAADAAVPFVGIWLEAPETTLITRVEQRRDDASDADAAVIRLQHRDGTGVMRWRRLDASRPPGVVLGDASKYIHDLVQLLPSFCPLPLSRGAVTGPPRPASQSGTLASTHRVMRYSYRIAVEATRTCGAQKVV